MEWLKELIKKHTKDGVLNQGELLKEVNTEFPKHAVPKDQYNALAETKTKLEGDLADRDVQLEDLKKVDAAGLQAEIERLQGENQAATDKYQKELKDLQLTNAIKLALAGKVYDEDLASGLIKRDELILSEEGKVVGLDAQIESLQESKAFLFKQDEGKKDEGQEGGFQKVGHEGSDNSGNVDTAIAAAFGNTQE